MILISIFTVINQAPEPDIVRDSSEILPSDAVLDKPPTKIETISNRTESLLEIHICCRCPSVQEGDYWEDLMNNPNEDRWNYPSELAKLQVFVDNRYTRIYLFYLQLLARRFIFSNVGISRAELEYRVFILYHIASQYYNLISLIAKKTKTYHLFDPENEFVIKVQEEMDRFVFSKFRP
jgi:hypothetical protein